MSSSYGAIPGQHVAESVRLTIVVIGSLLLSGSIMSAMQRKGDLDITKRDYFTAALYGEVSELARILDAHPDWLEEANSTGTALHYAVRSKDLSAARLLLRKGLDIDTMNRQGETALHVCATLGLCDAATFLLDHGADVNLSGLPDDRRPDGTRYVPTPLSQAAAMGELKMVQLLLDRGAKIVRDPKIDQVTAIHAACNPHLPLSELPSPDNRKVIELLIKNGANINSTTPTGETPLFWAVRGGWLEIVEYLIKRPDVIVSITERGDGRGVLHIAVHGACNPALRPRHTPEVRKRLAMAVRLLVEAGADPKRADIGGKTPMDLAKDCPEVLEALQSDQR